MYNSKDVLSGEVPRTAAVEELWSQDLIRSSGFCGLKQVPSTPLALEDVELSGNEPQAQEKAPLQIPPRLRLQLRTSPMQLQMGSCQNYGLPLGP